MRANGIITLLTDFGDSDGYVGSMAGAVLSINRNASIVNISHRIERHNIESAAFVLSTYFSYYPPGTVHVAVVDPGVGGPRKAIAVEADGYIFLAPDNGILSYILEQAANWNVYELINETLFLPHISHTFHGRDIFCPVAAHLAGGMPINKVGPKCTDPKRFEVMHPIKKRNTIQGAVRYMDTFGNIITNIPADWIKSKSFQLFLGDKTINQLSKSYNTGQRDELIALIGSAGLIEIAVNKGNAQQQTGLKKHDPITIVMD